MRLRKAMIEFPKLLTGLVEIDETYIGGKPKKGNDPYVSTNNKRGRGTSKIPLVGLVSRETKQVVIMVEKELTGEKLSGLVRKFVDPDNATVISDEYRGYNSLNKFIKHYRINHQINFANGFIHINNIEGFWAILKRGIVGQFHKVSVKYLPMYLAEFSFRFNHRKTDSIFEHILGDALNPKTL